MTVRGTRGAGCVDPARVSAGMAVPRGGGGAATRPIGESGGIVSAKRRLTRAAAWGRIGRSRRPAAQSGRMPGPSPAGRSTGGAAVLARFVAVVAAGVLLAAAADPPSDAATKELALLKGTWRAAAAEEDGQKAPDA